MAKVVVVKRAGNCLNMRQLLNPIFYSRKPVHHPCRKQQRSTRLRDLTRARQRQIKRLRVWQLPELPRTEWDERMTAWKFASSGEYHRSYFFWCDTAVAAQVPLRYLLGRQEVENGQR